jgi:N-acyl-D-aspartate/D-glutamate deacylase
MNTAVLLLSLSLGADPVEADVILKGGTLFDGGGTPGFVGDVAIKGDRIVAVGQFGVAGSPRVIDCTGLYFAPGFIDLHTHSDEPLQQPKTRANRNYLRQGVTTVVTGNCGSGPTNVAEYFAALEKEGIGSNVIHQMPHNNLRLKVMGNVNRDPSAKELAAMKELVDKGMRNGAWGLSTGLIYNPGTYSKTEEIIALAKVAARHHGFYASHIRNEGVAVLDAVEEALRIGREAGLPVHISHLKASGRKVWGGKAAEVVALIKQARAAGQVVTADQYPYAASSTSLRAMVVPARYREGAQEDLVRRFDDNEIGPNLRAAIERTLSEMNGGADLRVARYSKNPKWQGRDLVSIAAEEQKTPLEIVVEIERNGGAQIVHFGMNEDDVRLIMKQDFVATASDGSANVPNNTVPHPRSYGCFARKIGYFAIQEKVLPVEQAIRSASGLPADILKLADRGYLRAGYFADVVVFDPKTYRDTATFDKPHQYATGVKWLFVNGKLAIEDGKDIPALAGRVLRHKVESKGEH